MKDLYESIFKNSPVAKGISTYDEGIFIEVNSAFTDLTEYSKEEMIGKKSINLGLFNTYSRQKMIDKLIKDGSVKNDEVEITAKSGKLKQGLYSAEILEFKGQKCLLSAFVDITEQKQIEHLQILSNKILRSLNGNQNLKDTITNIIQLIKQETRYSAIGIRLKKNEDFPYFAQSGFTEDFVSAEDNLAVINSEGEICRDKDGKPLLECACGLVLNGKKNKALTKAGSLYTNNSEIFLDLTPNEDPRINPRNRCIRAGYESIAIIPIRTKEVIIGTLQLNDKNKDAFTEEIIIFFEGICELIGAALMRKQTEELLKQSEEKFREIFDEAPIGIALYNNSGTLINMNEAYLKIFGVDSVDNIKYLNLFKHPHPIESFNSAEILQSLEKTDSWEGNVNFDFDEIRSHGNLISNRTGIVYLYLNIINFNGDNSFLVMAQDVTVTNNYVFQIKESEEKFRNIFYKSPIAINIYNEDGILQDVNEKSIDMMGVFGAIDKTEWAKFNLFDDPNLPVDLKELLKIDGKWEGESVFDFDQFKTYFPEYNINKFGKMYLRVSIVAQEISKDSKYMVQLQDITEYKKYTDKLKELNDTKDKFFSIISHDLKSPFNSILGFTDILNESYFKYTDDERLNFIRNIKNSALNAFELLQNLLDWANTQTQNEEYYPEYLDMSLLLNNVIKTIGPAALIKNIKIYPLVDYKTSCYGDEEMIKTILRNLLTNAIKFTNKNGNILISSEYTEDYLKVSIKDDGIGISQTTIDKLFKIGEKIRKTGTDQERGTGLGLIICKEFITKMGGNIWVESELNKGSKFTFTIPIRA